MKPTERTLQGQSNMGGERVGMSIDQSALSHIMSVLTDLYSDPELAVIREYSTNALDSHVEAGVNRPIEVTLPSALSPFLRIRDYGIGLDADGIRNVYSQYGTSTKRESDDVVGMLGLGCKSALTYTDQFTLTGIRDGIMTQVSVSRDEDGGGSMTIVAQHETDDEQGVEVIVPVKRYNAFESKAHEFFKFWDEGTVLVNSEHPKRVDGLWISDDILLTQALKQDYVVMGNVAYPVPEDHSIGPARKANRYARYNVHHAVAFVPIGAVQFTPSREALQMTRLTKDTLAKVAADVESKTLAAVQEQIRDAPTTKAALTIFKEAKALGVSNGLTYKGYPVQDTLARYKLDAQGVAIKTDAREGFLIAGGGGDRRKGGEWTLQVDLSPRYDNYSTLWFRNFENAELTKVMRMKLREWATQRGVSLERARLILTKAFTASEKFWLDGETVYDWADVSAIKLPKNAVLDSGRPKGSYAGRQNGQWSDKIVADTIDTKKLVLWANGNRWSVQSTPEWRAGIVPDDATLVALPRNRIDKFCRDFPTAKKLHTFGQEYAAAFVARQSAEDMRAAAFQRLGGMATRLAKLDPTRVDDPELKEAIALATRNVTTVINELASISRWSGGTTLTPTMDNPSEKYVLLPYSIYIEQIEHIYLYLNAAYAAGRSA